MFCTYFWKWIKKQNRRKLKNASSGLHLKPSIHCSKLGEKKKVFILLCFHQSVFSLTWVSLTGFVVVKGNMINIYISVTKLKNQIAFYLIWVKLGLLIVQIKSIRTREMAQWLAAWCTLPEHQRTSAGLQSSITLVPEPFWFLQVSVLNAYMLTLNK